VVVSECSVSDCQQPARVSAGGAYDFGPNESGWLLNLRLCDAHAQLLEGKHVTVFLRDEDYGSPRFEADRD
jgi:hypothetical protein